jgi:hypothetical protein
MKQKNQIITFILITATLLTFILSPGISQPEANAQNQFELVGAELGQRGDPPEPLPTEKSKELTDSVESRAAEPIKAVGFEAVPDTMVVKTSQRTLQTPLTADKSVVRAATALDAWTTITAEDFEGDFPGTGWVAFDDDGLTNGEYYWDADTFKPYSGSKSGWPASGGADGYSAAAGNYPDDLLSWLVYGPFDLSDATDAELLFYYWLDTEIDYDFFEVLASSDGTNFYGFQTSGNSGGWLSFNFDLTAVPELGDLTGQSNGWIAFLFSSDYNVHDFAGPFIDDILLQKYAGGAMLRTDPVDGELTLGGETTVDIMAENISGLYAAQMALQFDPALVEVVDAESGTTGTQVTPGSCPPADFVAANSVDNETGIISYAATALSPSPPCDGGLVMSITFRGLAPGVNPLDFNSWLLANSDGQTITSSAQGGTLTVLDRGTIAGIVAMQGRIDHSGAMVCANDGSGPICVETGADGQFSIDVATGTYAITVNMERYLDAEKLNVSAVAGSTTTLPAVTCLGGDSNDDCNVNILDLALMGGRFSSSCGDVNWDERADINNDCTVNILDLAMAGGNFGATCPVAWPES